MGFWKNVVAAFSSEPVEVRFAEDQIPVMRAIQAFRNSPTSGPISRDLAMEVPAVVSGRNLICNFAGLPLVQLDADKQTTTHPLFDQIERNRPNLIVLTDTIEDLLFDRIAYWRVTERQADGYPYKAERVELSRVTVTEEHGRKVIRIDGKAVQARDVIRFESPNHGLCDIGGKPIRRALLADQALAVYAENPRALDYFSERINEAGTFDKVEDVDEALAGWREARQNNSTGFVPAQLEYHTVDLPAGLYDSLLKMREASTLDIANLLNLDSEDFNISTTSRTYFNADQKRKERINDVLAPYMSAITSRLSMGDVTKRGYTAEFDTSKWLDPDPITRIAYYEGLHRLGAIDNREVARRERLTLPTTPTPVVEEAPDDVR